VLLQKGRKRGESPGIGQYGGYEERMETGKREGGCRGKEISVSAKVFIKILRQMISVSFS